MFVQDDCSLVIGDFNAIRAEIGDDQQSKTEYVVTRWYRAPEVMASETKYSYGTAYSMLYIVYALVISILNSFSFYLIVSISIDVNNTYVDMTSF